MSSSESTFSPSFKASLVIELLEGKKDAATIAAENSIEPELLLSWQQTFLEKAPSVFGKKGGATSRKKLARARKENKARARKAEKLAREVQWLEGVVAEELGPDWESKFSPKPF